MASANCPRAAATAFSQPASISINEASEPRVAKPRGSRRSAAAPFRDCAESSRASSFDSSALRERSATRSASTSF